MGKSLYWFQLSAGIGGMVEGARMLVCPIIIVLVGAIAALLVFRREARKRAHQKGLLHRSAPVLYAIAVMLAFLLVAYYVAFVLK